MHLTARTVHVALDDRWPELILSEGHDGEGRAVEIFLDDYYTVIVRHSDEDERTCSECVAGWSEKDGRLEITVTPAAAEELGTDEVIVIEFDPARDAEVCQVLEQLKVD